MHDKQILAYGNDVLDGSDLQITVIMPTECPLCKRGYYGRPLSTWSDRRWVCSLYYCNGCSNFFISGGHQRKDNLEQMSVYSHPSLGTITKFNNSIEELSPNFVKIYNEASQAEEKGLTKICGAGFRKSLEFLVKDYASHMNPEKTEEIRDSNLWNVISLYIKHEDIKILAQKSAWIGNDETHYVRIHDDLDFQDLKEFINAILGYVTAELSVKKAKGISSKK